MLKEPSPLNQSPLALTRQNAVKSRNLSPLKLLSPLIRPYRAGIGYGLLAVLASGGCVLALGQIFRFLVDSALRNGNETALSHALLVMLGLVVTLAVASYGRLVLLTGYAEQIMTDLRRKTLGHLLRLDVGWFDRHKTGDLMSRLTSDISVLQVLLGTSLPVALRNIIVTIGGLVMMTMSSPALSGFVLCLVPVIAVILLLLSPGVRKQGKAVQEKLGLVGATLNESLGAIREVQAFGHETSQEKKFGALSDDVVKTTWRYMHRRAGLSSLIILVVFSSIAGLLWFGGHQVIDGTLTPGELSSFVFYALLVAGSVGALSEVYGDLQRAAGALERIDEILSVTPTIIATAKAASLPQPVQGRIMLDNVSFAYPSRPDISAIHNLSLTIQPEQTIAIVGASGSGKTTLFNLLLRFYDPTSGRILMDGVDIRDLDPAQYRALFGYVPQDPVLFSATIRENIQFGMENATSAEVAKATQDAGVDIFVKNLPDQFETMLGERGTRLSGGQAQRVALARAFLRDPLILLLDEATAHLDSETERAIQNALSAQRKRRTTLIIAHRLSTVQHADRILLFDKGTCIADGTHDELLATSTTYQRLTAAQFRMES